MAAVTSTVTTTLEEFSRAVKAKQIRAASLVLLGLKEIGKTKKNVTIESAPVAHSYLDLMEAELDLAPEKTSLTTIAGVTDWQAFLCVSVLLSSFFSEKHSPPVDIRALHLMKRLLPLPGMGSSDFYEQIREILFNQLFWTVWRIRRNDSGMLRALWSLFIGFKLPEGNRLCQFLLKWEHFEVVDFTFDCLRDDFQCYNNAIIILRRYLSFGTKPISDRITKVPNCHKLLFTPAKPPLKAFALIWTLKLALSPETFRPFLMDGLPDFCLRGTENFPVAIGELSDLTSWVRITVFVLPYVMRPEILVKAFAASHLPSLRSLDESKAVELRPSFHALEFAVCEYLIGFVRHYSTLLPVVVDELGWDDFILESARQYEQKTELLDYKNAGLLARLEVVRVFCMSNRFVLKLIEAKDVVALFCRVLVGGANLNPLEYIHFCTVVAELAKHESGQELLDRNLSKREAVTLNYFLTAMLAHSSPTLCDAVIAKSLSLYEGMVSVADALANVSKHKSFRLSLSTTDTVEVLKTFITNFFGENGAEGLDRVELIAPILTSLVNLAKDPSAKKSLCTCAISNLLHQVLLFQYYEPTEGSKLKKLACIAIINFAAEQKKDANKTELANHGCIEALVGLLRSTPVYAEYVFWALANLLANATTTNQNKLEEMVDLQEGITYISQAFGAAKANPKVAHRGCQFIVNACRDHPSLTSKFKKSRAIKECVIACAENPMKEAARKALSL